MSPSAMISTNPAPTLADFTSPGLILPQLRGRDASAVIQELSQVLQSEQRVPDLRLFHQTVLNRESLMSSDLEAGMAFPHARLPVLKKLSFAFGRSQQPINWSGQAGSKVQMVFLMAVPEDDSGQYLSLISGLARLAKDRRLVEKLLTAPDAVQMFAALQEIKLRTHPAPAPLPAPVSPNLSP